jgi:alkanesulfonate monooxygenase SsuD/methylene tetrahydromethanopterin reductase-like flavin-dependent oxidoreductase (luciferase family)
MFIGYFTESPYQDLKSEYFGPGALPVDDLNFSNRSYDSRAAADLLHRYLDEKLYAEEVGFDGVCLNEHHSTPFCMRGVANVEAAILARTTSKVRIVLIGNILSIWEDPLWLAEELAIIDTLSRGRLVTGWVRGGGRESLTHNSQPPYNWERFQEGLEFIIKTWTTPGPFRWEGKHFQYRYVNPWAVPWQNPHPPVWIPGIVSRRSV